MSIAAPPPKSRQSAIQPKKHLLRKILDVFAAADQPRERSKDHRLMIAHHLLEADICLQGKSDCDDSAKFHSQT